MYVDATPYLLRNGAVFASPTILHRREVREEYLRVAGINYG
jgi:hypothetical protein